MKTFPVLTCVRLSELQPPKPKRKYGKWTYSKRFNTLTINVVYPYEVDLDRCRSPAEFADWVLHLSAKTWMTEEQLGHFVQACRHICGSAIH